MYRKSQPEPLPYQRNFRVRLGQGHLLIATTRLLVTVHHFSSPRAEPDYTIRFMVSDNPDLAAILHPVEGWDFVGLIYFLWRKIDVLKHLDLRGVDLKKELGIDTVSVPSQTRARQEKRTMEQAMSMIRSFILKHPNCTRLEIARGIDRSKNPYLLTQIEWLVNNGTLARTTNVRPNGAIEYRYIVVDDNADY